MQSCSRTRMITLARSYCDRHTAIPPPAPPDQIAGGRLPGVACLCPASVCRPVLVPLGTPSFPLLYFIVQFQKDIVQYSVGKLKAQHYVIQHSHTFLNPIGAAKW